MRIGPYDICCVLDGTFGLDGGAMFGIVPKPLWERTNPADDRNRIDLAARCLLVRSEERIIVVDTGLGDKYGEKDSQIYKIDRSAGGLVAKLGERGIGPEDVTDVILTHLHFDHCGGTTRVAEEGARLTFPNAVHHLQLRNWNRAHQPAAKDAGSFRDDDYRVLEGSGRLHIVNGALELFPGIHLHVVEGHTPAMQLVRITDGDAGLLFLADLAPTRAHLRWPYIMSYDNQPLVTLAEKRQLLPRAARDGWVVVFEHDPSCAAAALRLDGDTVVVDREIEL